MPQTPAELAEVVVSGFSFFFVWFLVAKGFEGQQQIFVGHRRWPFRTVVFLKRSFGIWGVASSIFDGFGKVCTYEICGVLRCSQIALGVILRRS